MVPERVLSLALLNVTGGGYECIPKVWILVGAPLLTNLIMKECAKATET